METPEKGPMGPRGPKTTSPDGEPLKKEDADDSRSSTTRRRSGEEAVRDIPPEPSRPHGDPMREQLPR